jgi:hypothetical protein
MRTVCISVVTVGMLAALTACGSGASTLPTTPTGAAQGAPSTPTGGGEPVPSATPTTSGSSVPSACPLLTVSQIENITGASGIVMTQQMNVGGESNCFYGAPNSVGSAGVAFVLNTPGAQAVMEADLAEFAPSLTGSPSAVSGLGTAAIKAIDATSVYYAFSTSSYLVILGVNSTTVSGSTMDPQLQSVAQADANTLG